MRKLTGVIEAQQFDRDVLEEIFLTADYMRMMSCPDLLRGKILGNVFYEESTRTRWSFEIAMLKLGGQCISTENAGVFSSAAKGESLEDTIRVLSGYPLDVIALRYHKEGGAKRAEKHSFVPIINAGDGTGQHPTQAFLDLYTIKKKFGTLNGLNIALMGDLANGRTVRSLCYLIAKHFPDNIIHLISPKQVAMREDIKDYMTKCRVKWLEHTKISKPLTKIIDVWYQTRIQKNRFKEDDLYQQVMKEAEFLIIDEDRAEQMKETSIIEHPLPRKNEIKYAVDGNPRAYYFPQAWNGVYVRMALLKMILIGY